MSVIFAAQMEADFSEFTSETDTDSHLNWSASAALAGTAGGMAMQIADTTAAYCTKTGLSISGSIVRARIYIDPNSMTMGNGEDFTVFLGYSDVGDILGIHFGYLTASGYFTRVMIKTDAGAPNYSVTCNITDAPHCIEALWTRATNDFLRCQSRLVGGWCSTNIQNRNRFIR